MINVLKSVMRARGKTPADIAKRLGISEKSVIRKLSLLDEFSPTQKTKIKGFLKWNGRIEDLFCYKEGARNT